MGVQRIPRGDMAADVPLGDVPLGGPAIDFKRAKEIFYSKLLKKKVSKGKGVRTEGAFWSRGISCPVEFRSPRFSGGKKRFVLSHLFICFLRDPLVKQLQEFTELTEDEINVDNDLAL